jgi:putative aldouronate transport system substrate-binding protein
LTQRMVGKWKKILFVGLAAAMVLIVAACGNSNTGGDKTAAPAAPAASDVKTEGNQAVEKEKPFPISIMIPLYQPELPSDVVKSILEEKTNTKLDFQWVPQADRDQKLQIHMATNKFPTVVIAHLQAFKNAANTGQFWDIEQYLSEFPNLSQLDPAVINNTRVGGKVYGLYQERPLSRQGVFYRKDWADKLGVKTPTTTDELFDMFYQFTHNDPDGNGKPDTIGLADRGDLVYGAFKTIGSYFGVPNNWGVQDGKLAPEFMFPEYKQNMEFFKKMRDAGIINQDFPVTSKTDQQAMFTSGKAGGYLGAMNDVETFYNVMVEINPDVVLDVHNRVAAPGKEPRVWAIPGFGDLFMFPKQSIPTEDDLRKVLAFFDELMAPELANLISYGLEGTHYTLDNGNVIVTEDTALFARDVAPFAQMIVGGPNTIDMHGIHYKAEVRQKAEELFADNNNIVVHDPTVAFESATYVERGAQLGDIIRDATYKFILGEIDEAGFDSAIERWLKEGGSNIVEEFNAQYK